MSAEACACGCAHSTAPPGSQPHAELGLVILFAQVSLALQKAATCFYFCTLQSCKLASTVVQAALQPCWPSSTLFRPGLQWSRQSRDRPHPLASGLRQHQRQARLWRERAQLLWAGVQHLAAVLQAQPQHSRTSLLQWQCTQRVCLRASLQQAVLAPGLGVWQSLRLRQKSQSRHTSTRSGRLSLHGAGM